MLRSCSEGGKGSPSRFRFSSSAKATWAKEDQCHTKLRSKLSGSALDSPSQQVLQYEMFPPGTCRLGGTFLSCSLFPAALRSTWPLTAWHGRRLGRFRGQFVAKFPQKNSGNDFLSREECSSLQRTSFVGWN